MKPTIHFLGHTIAADEFEQRTLRAAATLRARGVGDGDVVAMLMRNHPTTLELILAARWVGAQWCPINWHYKADEVHYIVDDSGAKVLVADRKLLDGLEDPGLGGVQLFVTHGTSEHHPGATPWEPLRDATPPVAGPAAPPRGAMFYTSGTTGRPKGIRREPSTPEQLAAGALVRKLAYGLVPEARALVSAPMYHSAPNAYALGAAMEGAHLFIEERFDAERTLQLIEQHRLTHAYLVPTMYVRMLVLPDEVKRRYDLSSMRFVGSTGSPCAPEVKRAMIEWWGPVINECYGSSELGYMTLLTSEQALRKPGSAGLPMPGVTLAILDEQGRRLPAGQAGLIYAHQPATSDFTYVNNGAARARMEVDGMKTMGDIGYLDDDGFLFIVDRSADMVISGGVNIYPAEIEAVLQTLPGVADCAVFGVPDAEFGESLVAAVQPRDGATLDAAALQEMLRERIASYKVPKLMTFHEQLPREDTGKIFKRKLREPYWAGQARRV